MSNILEQEMDNNLSNELEQLDTMINVIGDSLSTLDVIKHNFDTIPQHKWIDIFFEYEGVTSGIVEVEGDQFLSTKLDLSVNLELNNVLMSVKILSRFG